MTLEEFDALSDEETGRRSFACFEDDHDVCRGRKITADWHRIPCECECHGEPSR